MRSMADGQELEHGDLEGLKAEVALYRNLLGLAGEEELEPFLTRALALLVRAADARAGYLELRSPDATEPEFWTGHVGSDEDLSSFRSSISQGVISEALATAKTVSSANALEDPRFRDRGSVRQNAIEAILCAPIGTASPLGVVYLQDRKRHGPFSDQDRERVETLAKLIAPYVERLVLRQKLGHADPTAPFRATLRGTETLVGQSESFAEVLRQVSFVAAHDLIVLLTGPTGTGKTLLARILHQNSPRAAAPFVEVNCGALPENLVENELFGAVKGGHSTASNAVLGKVGAAEGGTLFLDEIGNLTLPAQAKLLQLLQSSEYFPVGASRPVSANIRVIVATNRDLREAVVNKTFRDDLFYRLDVMPIRLPGLDERPEDIPELAVRLCKRVCQANRLPALRLSPAGLNALETADWPGNVRQLENCLAGAALRTAGEGALEIEPRHLFPRMVDAASATRASLTYQDYLAQFRHRLLTRVLADTDWNVSEAARRLDVKRSYVNKLIRAFQLKRRTTDE